MPGRSNQYRQFARRALVARAGSSAASHQQISSAFSTLREHLAHALVPVFGATAVNALFERSRNLAMREFGWVAEVLSTGPSAQTLDASTLSAVKTTEEILDGLSAVLAHDVGLLSALVGKDLILPLVEKAWGATGPMETSGESD